MKRIFTFLLMFAMTAFFAVAVLNASQWSNPSPQTPTDKAGQLLVKHETVIADIYSKMNLIRTFFAGSSAPTSPDTGEPWYDTTNHWLRTYDAACGGWGCGGLYSSGTSSLYTLQVTNITKVGTGVISNLNSDLLDGYHEASANTGNTIVRRDASGNFAAGTITATLNGSATYATNAGSATNATNATNATTATNATNATTATNALALGGKHTTGSCYISTLTNQGATSCASGTTGGYAALSTDWPAGAIMLTYNTSTGAVWITNITGGTVNCNIYWLIIN